MFSLSVPCVYFTYFLCIIVHRELKDNLGSDDPEGDIPVLLQATLARNPNVFREKSMQNRYAVQSGKKQSARRLVASCFGSNSAVMSGVCR